ncbi:MAG TPA: sigma-70 family RNA polymerase sigma factor [Actinomycetota bacterium]|nr:sigma-70 family RNA polymerase sigma factor [Actinomycetota bacterium]
MGAVGRGSPAGDEAAFTMLVRDHGGVVFGVIYRRVGDRAAAEDLTQETFLRAWRARAAYRGGPSGARGWLCTIAANVARDHLRKQRRRVVEEEAMYEDIPAVTGDPVAGAEAAASLEQLRAALASLPPNYREMFLLRERDGLSYKEIAAVMSCPIGSVMSGLARARERLLDAMES